MTVILSAVLAFVACNDEPEVGSAGDEMYVSILLQTGDPSLTRADLPEEDGSFAERYINLNDIKILIFRQNADESEPVLHDIWYDGDHAVGSEGVSGIGIEDLGNGQYRLKAKIVPVTAGTSPKYDRTSSFSIVATANWSSLIDGEEPTLKVGATKLSDVRDGWILKVNTERIPDANLGPNDGPRALSWEPDVEKEIGIPMTGAKYVSLSGYDKSVNSEGNPYNLGTIDMIRALAKIEIVDARSEAEKENVPIMGEFFVNLARRNMKGALMQNFEFKGATGQVNAVTIPTSDGLIATDSLNLKNSNDAVGNNVYYCYVPEQTLSSNLNERRSIRIKIINKDASEDRFIFLAPYVNGEPTTNNLPDYWKGLLRNHIYRFTINKIDADPSLAVTVDVQPYSSYELNPIFGLERTPDGYIVVRNSDTNEIVKYIRTDGQTLTLQPKEMYGLKFNGVFDETKKVLLGYFSDGRSIYFNYNDVDQNELESWEIYDSNMKIAEEYSLTGHATNGESYMDPFTHSIYDKGGRVIQRFVYSSDLAFINRGTTGGGNPTVLVNYTKDENGGYTIKYYEKGTDTVVAEIVVDANGNETYSDDMLTQRP